MKKIRRVVSGLLVLFSITAALFFGIQYIHLTSVNTSYKKEIAKVVEERDTLQEDNASLKFKSQIYLQRNAELMVKYTEVQKELFNARIENSYLQSSIENLERQIKRINAPPVTADASSPRERLEVAFNLLRFGDLGAHWDFLNSEFREKCSRERFIQLGWRPGGEQISFIAQAVGHPYAVVWFSMKGANPRVRNQVLIAENGQWFIYAGTGGC